MAKQPPLLQKARAGLAYARFTGRAPTGSYAVQLDNKPTAAYRLGSLVGVAYEATRDGKTENYFHEFKRAARPDLAVRADGRQLYITRGAYHVTDRGIEDMSALFVMNPSRPLRSKSKRKPKMAATRRRSAKGRFLKLSRNPVSKRRARRTAGRGKTTIMVRNPVRRRRARGVVAARRSVRRFRRNPITGNLNMFSLVMPAIGIGAGAVAAELAMGYLPIPANFKTGAARPLTKGAIGLAGGWVVSKYVNRKAGELIALGALTVAAHDFIKDSVLLKFMPSLQFGAYLPATRGHPGIGYASPGQPTMAAYMPRMGGMGGRQSDGYGMYMHGAQSDGYAGRV